MLSKQVDEHFDRALDVLIESQMTAVSRSIRGRSHYPRTHPYDTNRGGLIFLRSFPATIEE